MKAQRWFLVLLLIFSLMTFMIGGCGSDDKGDTAPELNVDGNGEPSDINGSDEPDERIDEGSDDQLLHNYFLPGTFDNLIEKFSEIKIDYRYGNDQHEIHYQYMGRGTTQEGAEADRILMSVDDNILYFWLDDQDNVIQFDYESDQYPEPEDMDQANTAYRELGELFILPFSIIKATPIEEIMEGSLDGYEASVASTGKETLGNLTVDVYTVKVVLTELVVPEEITYTTRIVDFGDMQTMLSWKITEGEESFTFHFEILELDLR